MDVTEIPPELNAALIQFNNELVRWIDRGGDARVLEFEPLESWYDVVGLLTVRLYQ